MTDAPPCDRVTYLGHATVLLEIGGSRILTDPILRNRLAHLRRHGPAPELDGLTLDAILISHLHLDHLDLPSLRRLPLDTPVVVSGGGGRLLARAGFSAVEEVVPGDTLRVGAVSITAVEAVHDGRRWPFGAGAGSLGFVVGGSSRTYFAGDTDVFPEMSGLGALDLALLPVWGWGPTLGHGHMGPAAAARALALLRPRIAVPIHWGTLYPVGLGRYRPHLLTEPPRVFARIAAELAPAVAVRVLEPGSSLALRSQTAQPTGKGR